MHTVKQTTHTTHRSINRATHKLQGYKTTLTTTHVQEEIQPCKNNNSQGPDKLNIMHLIHIGPLGLAFLSSMLKTDPLPNIILLGDFNMPEIIWDNPHAYHPSSELLIDLATLLFLNQQVSTPTQKSNDFFSR